MIKSLKKYYYIPRNYTTKKYTVQGDLLVGVIFGKFACGKKLVDFILAISCHVPLSMLRLKKNGGYYIGDFFIEPHFKGQTCYTA